MSKIPHGTKNGYDYHQCRCAACTEANRLHFMRWQNTYGLTADLTGKHGKASTYNNYGCRCQPCTDANTKSSRDWRDRRKRGAA